MADGFEAILLATEGASGLQLRLYDCLGLLGTPTLAEVQGRHHHCAGGFPLRHLNHCDTSLEGLEKGKALGAVYLGGVDAVAILAVVGHAYESIPRHGNLNQK